MDKKLIVFKEDSNYGNLGDKCYIKMIADDKALFYEPLVAPREFKNYISENNLKEAYIIKNGNILEQYKKYVYTFSNNGSYYDVKKGYDLDIKYAYFINDRTYGDLGYKKYSYLINDNDLTLKDYKKSSLKKYCYLFDEIKMYSGCFIQVEELAPYHYRFVDSDDERVKIIKNLSKNMKL